jgi:hypothetical protein
LIRLLFVQIPVKPRPSTPLRFTRRARARGRIGFRRADRMTLGLAVLAVATAGTVIAVEYGRRLQRRLIRQQEEGGTGPLPEHPVEAAQLAAGATRDTVRVAIEGYGSAPRHELVLFNLLSGFVFSFALVRVSTAGIRSGWWPFGNVRVGGRHIHHFVPGILLAFSSGTAALITDDLDTETALAVPFGVGVGLTFDEAALLLDLRDVYWTREGLLSLQVSLGFVSVLAGTIVALRILRRGERRGEERGLIPDAGGRIHAPAPSPVATA